MSSRTAVAPVRCSHRAEAAVRNARLAGSVVVWGRWWLRRSWIVSFFNVASVMAGTPLPMEGAERGGGDCKRPERVAGRGDAAIRAADPDALRSLFGTVTARVRKSTRLKSRH